ncbi:MAG: 4Fe-4S dicluster domain-containing protein [Chlorobium sp.]|uniref:4Fe-4S dicluster domain-containing protein n=1 Tax=Chlorobium sp. TaxID=1095 RepID=UPI001D3E409C|nr:4Fe-4S dicluster domain-containing protein [Chlorobium sp.]MBN1278544.1 4Fe-4S dicluster domain-containing protein [Chlorobiaceae bacterium]MCF8215550.1 4Fe-4S dicluster domain-containing protein [Chlorobium sp.]MCF8270396.1 4Fe-4S dicluster domain-containing protein [Chlorobium sp.]MCF8286765.1 4Fe-4S dicluster domain-containing protein [Chlorobium sp.]MCF8290287.1 4Fe-4S dicluster domain-containing protein [Chlorobium sp.]
MSNKKNYGMVIDTRVCVGCSACVYACKQENHVPEGYCRDWVVQETGGEYPKLTMENRSERCQHCENAPCVTYCPTRASHYAEDGTVQINRSLCTGCKACMAACPYDARYVHPEGYVDKCSLCKHRIEQGLETACVSICPTGSLHLVDFNNMDQKTKTLLSGKVVYRQKEHAGTEPGLQWISASNKHGA